MLYYKEYFLNEKADWVVFVHGAGGSSAIWFKQLKDFKAHFNLLLIDLRGHGKSVETSPEKQQGNYSFEAIANGEYNLVSRWSPRDNENLKTKALVEIEYYISTLIMRKEHFELDRIKTTN